MKFNNLDIWDISLTKFAVFFATLFLISFWPVFAEWVTETNWIWFLIPALLASIKPMIKVFKK